MNVLVPHSRDGSGSMSGENRVIEDGIAFLTSAGHEVASYQDGHEHDRMMGCGRASFYTALGGPGGDGYVLKTYGSRQNHRYLTGTFVTRAVDVKVAKLEARESLGDSCYCLNGIREPHNNRGWKPRGDRGGDLLDTSCWYAEHRERWIGWMDRRVRRREMRARVGR